MFAYRFFSVEYFNIPDTISVFLNGRLKCCPTTFDEDSKAIINKFAIVIVFCFLRFFFSCCSWFELHVSTALLLFIFHCHHSRHHERQQQDHWHPWCYYRLFSHEFVVGFCVFLFVGELAATMTLVRATATTTQMMMVVMVVVKAMMAFVLYFIIGHV